MDVTRWSLKVYPPTIYITNYIADNSTCLRHWKRLSNTSRSHNKFFFLCSPTMTIELKHIDLTIIIALSCSRYIRLYHTSACHVCVTKRRKNYPSTHYYYYIIIRSQSFGQLNLNRYLSTYCTYKCIIIYLLPTRS